MTWLMVPQVMEALHIKKDKKATEQNNLNYQGGSYPPYVPPVNPPARKTSHTLCVSD